MLGDGENLSSDEDVPLEVSNETAKKQSIAQRQAEAATSKLKKRKRNKKADLNESLMSKDDDDTSDVQSDTLYSEMNPGDEGKNLSDQREDMSQLMTDDESSNSTSSDEDEEEDGEYEADEDEEEETDGEANGQNVAGEELLGISQGNRSNVQSEMNQVENKGKVNQENRIKTQLPIQWKNGTNISSANGTSSNGADDVSISSSLPQTRKRFEIRRADKANRIANRLVYRRPAAALGLNFKEKMLYSTSRINRIDASTLMANRQRRSHF